MMQSAKVDGSVVNLSLSPLSVQATYVVSYCTAYFVIIASDGVWPAYGGESSNM